MKVENKRKERVFGPKLGPIINGVVTEHYKNKFTAFIHQKSGKRFPIKNGNILAAWKKVEKFSKLKHKNK